MPSKVLFIEDESHLRENIAELLGMKGYQVVTASDGRQGIVLALREVPDLIICDILLPYQNGYQVLETIRKTQSVASTPFIFLTGKSQLSDLRQGMNQGADDYLTKPFKFVDLLEAVESRIQREKYRIMQKKAPDSALTAIRGRDKQGYMTLQTEECSYFFIENNNYFVLHTLGTFQIDMTFEELIGKLNPAHFFRVNRNVIIHRKTIQTYAYWEKGKYCLHLVINNQPKQVFLPKARYGLFKTWLSLATNELRSVSNSSQP